MQPSTGYNLSGTGDSQRAFAIETPIFIACQGRSGRFARITRISDSRESPDSRESCESIRANHATKDIILAPIGPDIYSSTAAGVWRKAPVAFPDSSSALERCLSAKRTPFLAVTPLPARDLYQKSREGGRSRKGALRKLSQIARQICAKLPVFRFVHQTKGAQNCRKFVVNLKVNFGQFLCKYPFSNAPFSEFLTILCLAWRISLKIFCPKILRTPQGVMDVRAFGSWMSAPKSWNACFLRFRGPA